MPDEVKQVAPVEQTVERNLHLVEFVDLVRPRVAPLQPELQAPAGHAVHHPRLVHAHAIGVGVEELVDFLRIHAELLGALPPVGLAAAGGLGLDHDDGDAVDQQHDVWPARRLAIDRELIGHPPVIGVNVFIVDQAHILRVLGCVEFVIDAILQPRQPLLVVTAAAQLGDDGIDSRIVGQHGRIQGFELLAQERQQQHLALVGPVHFQEIAQAPSPAQFGCLKVFDDLAFDGSFLVEQCANAVGQHTGIVQFRHEAPSGILILPVIRFCRSERFTSMNAPTFLFCVLSCSSVLSSNATISFSSSGGGQAKSSRQISRLLIIQSPLPDSALDCSRVKNSQDCHR